MRPTERQYDIILYGATGYTGEITAEYIAENSKNKEKWAISGRSKQKLEELKSQLTKINPNLSSLDIIPCDATDPQQIRRLASFTKVLINCVGPYTIYGEEVVNACVEQGTDYIDVTGEPPFYNTMVERYHESASQKGLYILPACGIFSAIPDVAVETVKEEFLKSGTKCASAQGYLKMNGKYAKSFSSGTWNTLINSFGRRKSTGTARSTAPSQKKKVKKVGTHWFSPKTGWAVPFVEGADLHVIRRTNELTQNEAGSDDFAYSQFVLLPFIPPIYVIIQMLWVMLAMLIAPFSWGRSLLRKRKISDGGPNKQQRAGASYDMWIYATGVNGQKKVLHAHGPSAYDTTGICAAETAFALVNDRDQMKPIYGVVTPGTVMNKVLGRRLAGSQCNMNFE